MTNKERIIEIIGPGMEPERAECKAIDILTAIEDSKLDLIINKLTEIEITLEVLSQPSVVYSAVPADGSIPNVTVVYECGICKEPVIFGQMHKCPEG